MESDRELLRVIDATLREATRRSGDWLVCRPGCTQCCLGAFDITELDAWRLRNGLDALRATDPARAASIQARAEAWLDATSGGIQDDDDLPCPALDPVTGCCDLYDARPVVCRTFGPATRIDENAFAACELCYQGATETQTAACAVEFDPDGLERAIIDASGLGRLTLVASALASPDRLD